MASVFQNISLSCLYISFYGQRLLTDESPRLRDALRYTIYGKSGVFDAERFIDVMQAFENFITAAKSGGGEDLNGDMAELGILQNQADFTFPRFLPSESQSKQPIQTRAALAFLLSEKGNFFREFLLDEVFLDLIFKRKKCYLVPLFPILRAEAYSFLSLECYISFNLNSP